MQRFAQHRSRRSQLHNLACIHHRQIIRHPIDNRQIVGDQQNRHPQLPLQIAQQIQDLRLDRHIQSGCGLIRHQQPGLGRQGHRDHYPLLHAARELEGKIPGPQFRGGNAAQLEQTDDLLPGIASRTVQQ